MTEISHINQRLAARYDGAAKSWHSKISDIGFPEAYRDLVSRVVPKQQVASVIDVGTGAGDFALAYLATNPAPQTLILLDISTEMLAVAGRKISPLGLRLHTHHGSIETLSAKNIDLALSAHVIEHCPDPVQALRDIFDRLTKGGQIVLAVSKPHWCTAIIRLIWRSKAYKPARVLEMLAAAGFKNIQHQPFRNGVPMRVSAGYTAIKPKGKSIC